MARGEQARGVRWEDEVRQGERSKWCRPLGPTVLSLAFTLSEMEPREVSEQGRDLI